MGGLGLNNTIYLLSGKKQSGKDTVGDYLKSEYGFSRYAFADRLKEHCLKIVNECYGANWNMSYFHDNLLKETKFYIPLIGYITPREFLQQYGTEFARSFNDNYWVDFLIKKIRESGDESIFITDVRFPNEIFRVEDSLQDFYNIFLVKLDRSTNEISQDTHSSENSMNEINEDSYDYLLDNRGTIQELNYQVDDMVDSCWAFF
jgi:hypothetical protein